MSTRQKSDLRHSSLLTRVSRLRHRLFYKQQLSVYAIDLSTLPDVAVKAAIPIDFQINSSDAIRILQSGNPDYALGNREISEIPLQLAAGEICVTGWHQGELVYYLWVQFDKRKLARRTSIKIGEGQAFIYSVLTHEAFRGKRIHPAALDFTVRWLAGQGYRRVLADLHVVNKASEKGIKAIGMQVIGYYWAHRWLWLRWASLDKRLLYEISGGCRRRGVTIKTVYGKEGLLEIRGDWESLTDRMAGHRHFFHLYEWYRSYLYALEENSDDVQFHVMFRDELAIAIFPLRPAIGHAGGMPARMLEIPHHKHMPLADIVCDMNEFSLALLKVMVDHLRHSCSPQWDCLFLPRFLHGSCAHSSLGSSSLHFVLYKPAGQCYYQQCSSYEETVQGVSRNFRSNLNKARNKLAKLEGFRYLAVHEKAALPEAFEMFACTEASGWKGRDGSGTAINLNPRIEGFYKALIENFGAIDSCQIHLLMVDEDCIAGLLALQVGTTVYIPKIGYNEKYAAFAPGHSLVERFMESCESGVKGIKMLNWISDAKWVQSWHPRAAEVRSAWIFNRTPRGVCLFCLAAMKQLAAAIYHRMRSRLEDTTRGGSPPRCSNMMSVSHKLPA